MILLVSPFMSEKKKRLGHRIYDRKNRIEYTIAESDRIYDRKNQAHRAVSCLSSYQTGSIDVIILLVTLQHLLPSADGSQAQKKQRLSKSRWLMFRLCRLFWFGSTCPTPSPSPPNPHPHCLVLVFSFCGLVAHALPHPHSHVF